MAIQQYFDFTVNLNGDGSSTAVEIDMTEQIRLTGVLPRTPSGVVASGSGVSSACVNGAVVTVNFTAPFSGGVSIFVQLLF